jgi:hypothetical protein
MATKPVLPSAPVQTFNFGGKVYPSEEAAIRAVVEEIVDNTGIAATVLSRSNDLLPLLMRYSALQAATAAGQA